MKTGNIQGTIFSLFSNLCACKMSHRTLECSAVEKSITANNECLEMSSTTFYRRRWVGSPWWPRWQLRWWVRVPENSDGQSSMGGYLASGNISFVGPCPHRDRDYCIQSNFWKFDLIRSGFTLGEPVFLVKVFRLFRLDGFFWCSECGHSR
jgi:hypothetical protein